MITVACLLVKGHVGYTPEYVRRLRGMVARWLWEPYRFVCLTDQPRRMPRGVEAIAIPNPRPLRGWWAKVRLFDDRHKFAGRMLYLDLDTLIVGPLAPIVQYPSPFALVPHSGSFEGRDGLAVVKRFNSSVMVWNAGEQSRLFTEWPPKESGRLWGDQDAIGERAPDASTMPAQWFPRLSEIGDGPVPQEAVIVLAKKPKPEEAARRWTWVREAWAA